MWIALIQCLIDYQSKKTQDEDISPEISGKLSWKSIIVINIKSKYQRQISILQYISSTVLGHSLISFFLLPRRNCILSLFHTLLDLEKKKKKKKIQNKDIFSDISRRLLWDNNFFHCQYQYQQIVFHHYPNYNITIRKIKFCCWKLALWNDVIVPPVSCGIYRSFRGNTWGALVLQQTV